MKKLVLFSFVILCSFVAQSQPVKTVQKQEQAWLGYFNQTRFSKHWGLWVDAHLRRTDFLARPGSLIIRTGVSYFLADNVRLTAGYLYAGSYLSPSGTIRPEHRPWQHIWWSSRSGRLNLVQWVRAEQRFNHRVRGDQLGDGYGFNWRFRYNFLLQIPFKGETVRPGVLNFALQNEAFINAGKQINANYFDQNRFFVGVSYPFSKSFAVQAGYMNLFQQQASASGSTFVNNHTARLFLFHTLDFRRQAPATPPPPQS